MMKQHRFIFRTIVIAAVILAGLSACSIDESRLQEGLRRVSIKATIENDGPGTKVVIGDNDHGEEGDFDWNDDDALALYVVENGVGTYRFTENYGATAEANTFDIYMSPDATREGFAFYPPNLVLQNGNYQNYPLPVFDLDAPQVFMPPVYDILITDGQKMADYSPLPMIAVNEQDKNLNFKHLGGMIRLVFDRPILANRFRVAVGDIVDGTFRAYRINDIFRVINSNNPNKVTAADINNGNCFIQINENQYHTDPDSIWAFHSVYSLTLYPSHRNLSYGTTKLNIPVPTGHYTTVQVVGLGGANQDGGTNQDTVCVGTYSLGPDGWTCRRRHAWKLGITLDPFKTQYHLDTPEAVELTYTGGTASLRTDQLFKSYKTIPAQGTTTPATDKPVPYHLEYSEDGTTWSTTAPDWLAANSPSSFAGSVEGEDLTLTMEAQDNSTPDSHAATLRGKSELTDFDLSTVNVATGATVASTTANCYVVQAPGSYKIPLVYGNGVVDGAVNEDAFRSRAGVGGAYRPDAGDEALAPGTTTAIGWYMGRFKDHLDQYITTPYIANQLAGKELTAAVIWTDAKNLVTNASVTEDDDYITFKVPKEYICQGNALVAVLADGVIAWSWHIWVTDENLTVLKDGCNGYKFTTVNLGWCDGRTETYAERTCQVRAVQDAPGVTAENQLVTGPVTIRQTANTVTTLGNDVLYQWGRKDPLQGGDGSSETAFKVFYADNYAPEIAAGKVSLGTAIQNPYKFYTDGGGNTDWCSTSYYNNWNAALNDCDEGTKSVPVTKTIYDPTPVGFKMPPQAAYAGFNTTNFESDTQNGNKGRTYNGTLFFPATGQRRNTSGELINFGRNGYYWTTSSKERDYAYMLIFNSLSGDPVPAEEGRRTGGRSIRPAVEWTVTGENLIQWD